MAQATASISIEDWDGETSTTTVNVNDVVLAGTNFGSVTQDVDEIKLAIIAASRGEVRKVNINTIIPESADPVTDIEAAREQKWLVTYRDTTAIISAGYGNPGFGKLFTFEIGAANRTLLPTGSDELDLEDPFVVAIVSGLEPNIRSPFNRNPGAAITPTNEITSIKYVGRNI